MNGNPLTLNKHTFKRMFMVTKTITVTKDAYEQLKALKRPEESFSQEIKRITASKQDIMRFAGILTDKEGEEMLTAIKKMREESDKQLKRKLQL